MANPITYSTGRGTSATFTPQATRPLMGTPTMQGNIGGHRSFGGDYHYRGRRYASDFVGVDIQIDPSDYILGLRMLETAALELPDLMGTAGAEGLRNEIIKFTPAGPPRDVTSSGALAGGGVNFGGLTQAAEPQFDDAADEFRARLKIRMHEMQKITMQDLSRKLERSFARTGGLADKEAMRMWELRLKKFDVEMPLAIERVMKIRLAGMKVHKPVPTEGNLKRSIYARRKKVIGTQNAHFEVGSELHYAWFVENGFRPAWIPVSWVPANSANQLGIVQMLSRSQLGAYDVWDVLVANRPAFSTFTNSKGEEVTNDMSGASPEWIGFIKNNGRHYIQGSHMFKRGYDAFIVTHWPKIMKQGADLLQDVWNGTGAAKGTRLESWKSGPRIVTRGKGGRFA